MDYNLFLKQFEDKIEPYLDSPVEIHRAYGQYLKDWFDDTPSFPLSLKRELKIITMTYGQFTLEVRKKR